MQRISTFSRHGLRFDVTDEGPIDGPVVVLLHGFPANRGAWNGVAPLLHAAGMRTLAPDQRGYSPGARPTGRAAYRPRELVRDVLALIDASGAERVSIVGHDWGGIVAWWLGTVVPQRLDRITVVSTPHPRALTASLLSSDQAIRSSYVGLLQLPVLPERLLLPRLGALLRSSGLPHAVADDYASRMAEPGALTAALNWYRALLVPGGGRANGDGRIHVPTRYVWGRQDFALGRRPAELTERYVAAPYDFVEFGGGHWIPEKAPDYLATQILRPL